MTSSSSSSGSPNDVLDTGSLPVSRERPASATFSPDGSRVVTASSDQTAKVWEAKSGAEVLTLKGYTGLVRSATFSPDGSRVVAGSVDGTAKVWDAKNGVEVLTLKGHTDRVNSASFSPDGSQVVTGSDDNTAKVWDAKSGAEVLTLNGHTSFVRSATFSPDGSGVVTARPAGQIRDGGEARHGRDGGDLAAVHSHQRAAPDVQGVRGTRQRA